MTDPVRPAPSRPGTRVETLIEDTARLLAASANRLAVPLRWVVLAPLIAAVLLIAAAAAGSDLPWAVLLGVIGSWPAVWLALRRRELLITAREPERTTEALRSLLSVRDVLDQLKANLLRLPSDQAARPRTFARRLWRGIRFGNAIRSRLTDHPRLKPFLPTRLRTTGILVIVCLVSTVVLVVLAGLELIIGAMGSL